MANLSGCPAISVPVGYNDSGLPVGLQVSRCMKTRSRYNNNLPFSWERGKFKIALPRTLFYFMRMSSRSVYMSFVRFGHHDG